MVSRQEHDALKRKLEQEVAEIEELFKAKEAAFLDARKPFDERVNEKLKELEPALAPLRKKYADFQAHLEYCKESGLSVDPARVAAFTKKLQEQFTDAAKPVTAIEEERANALKSVGDELNELIRRQSKLKNALAGTAVFEEMLEEVAA